VAITTGVVIMHTGQFFLIEFTHEMEVLPGTAHGWFHREDIGEDGPIFDAVAPLMDDLRQSPAGFETKLHDPRGGRPMLIRWRPHSQTAGTAEFWMNGTLAARSLLLCGVEKSAEWRALRQFNREAPRRWRTADDDPRAAPRLLQLHERPLYASIIFLDKNDATRRVVLLIAQRAFAAAYFRVRFVA
jgi:hypothetical protein